MKRVFVIVFIILVFTANTLVFAEDYFYTNLFLNSDFETDSDGNGVADSWTSTASPSSLSNELCTSGQYSQKLSLLTGCNFNQSKTFIAGHKYYLASYVYLHDSLSLCQLRVQQGLSVKSMVAYDTTITGWQRKSLVFDSLGTENMIRFQFNSVASTFVYVDSAVLIDMTAVFGAGNEPTIEYMDKLPFFSDTLRLTVTTTTDAEGQILSELQQINLYIRFALQLIGIVISAWLAWWVFKITILQWVRHLFNFPI